MASPLVEITDVLQAPPSDPRCDSSLERPVPGSTIDRTTIEVAGWIVGQHSRARQVEVFARDHLLRTIPLDVPRPDVTARYSNSPETSGFWALTGTLGLDSTFVLDVHAVLDDGTRAVIGQVHGKRSPINSSFEPQLRPLMVNSLGRTGTTLLMNLLAHHPSVVTHRTHPYEMVPARYWLHLLRVLAEPANHSESSHPETFDLAIREIGHNPFHTAPITDHPDLVEFFGRSYVERLVEFCQMSIDGFYSAVAASQGQTSVEFFVEKFQPNHLPRIAWDIYPKAREIVLVRDFRDVICSVLAFNDKRQMVAFGRERTTTDEEYVLFIAGGAKSLVDDWKARRAISHLVRYEDLVRKPVQTVQRMLEYLELDRRPEVIETMVRSAFENPAFDDHRTSKSLEDSIGRWQRELSPSVLEVCREAMGDVLIEFDYDDSPLPAAKLDRRRISKRLVRRAERRGAGPPLVEP